MTAVAQRLAQLNEVLSPTQAAVQWLEQAHAFGSLSVYIAWARDEQDRNPLLTLPIQMIRAVKRAGKGQPESAIQETTQAAVREVLVRAYLVLWVNDHLIREQRADEMELELLTDTLPLALAARATSERRERWRSRAMRLRRECFHWAAVTDVWANRYYGGQSPLFPDAAQHLDRTTQTMDTLLVQWNRRARAEDQIDVRQLSLEGVRQVEQAVQQSVDEARHHTRVFLGERSGEFRLDRLVTYAELTEREVTR